jgi:hypothetical protein
MRARVHRRGERGYAILFVYALAASVLTLLWLEMPRAVFEGRRAKEQTLIDRGEQYKRGIQLYVRKYRRFPSTMEELESANGVRHLRKRYLDPMTGKDEWRIIHTNGMQLTDSKVTAPPTADGKAVDASGKPVSGSTTPEQAVFDPTSVKRAGDTSAASIGGASGQAAIEGNAPPPPPLLGPDGNPLPADQQIQNNQPLGPGAPNTTPNTPFPGVPFPGTPFPGTPPPNGVTPQNPNYGYPPGFPGTPGVGPQTAQPVPAPPQMPGLPAFPTQAATGQGFGQGGQTPLPSNNPAADLIRRQLTTPRAGGFPGAAASGQNGMQGGIAGVASKMEEKTIKVYNERERIDEWEFVYDPTKDTSMQQAGAAGGAQGGIPGMPGSPGSPGNNGARPGTPPRNTPPPTMPPPNSGGRRGGRN